MPTSNRTCAAPRGVKRVVVSIYIPEDLARNLKRVARAEDRSVSSFITRALADLRDPQVVAAPKPAEPSQAL